MKKFLPILVLLVLAVAAWYFSAKKQQTGPGAASNSAQNQNGATSNSGETSAGNPGSAANAAASQAALDALDAEDDDGTVDMEVQPASRAYKNADEALAAVKKGAADYDDSILEQFTEPGEDCTWCPEFYKGIRELLSAQGVSADQMSYYSELLAVSGRLENIQALVDGIKNPASEEQAEAFAEALELTVGKDAVVQFLADQLNTTDDRLKESSVAAITNQGSRLSAEILYKHTTEKGDPDGYYSLGIGLGEFVPDEESIPYLQELVAKKDQYSHLAVKALLNSGLDGLKKVFDSLSNSKDPDLDRQLLKDAIDHVNYEEEVENYLKEQAETQKQPALQEFAKKAIDAMRSAEAADAADEEQLQTPLNPG